MSKACKNAIKFNDKLDPTLPDRLISQLLYCEHPLYCVHGNKNFVILFSFIIRSKLYIPSIRAQKCHQLTLYPKTKEKIQIARSFLIKNFQVKYVIIARYL